MDLAIEQNANQVVTAAPGSLFARSVRPKDHAQFYALQQRNQERIKTLFEAFTIIEAAPTLSLGYDEACAQLGAGLRGMSPANLRRKYAEWLKSRDWRCLIDKALEYKPAQQMPQAFIDHVQEQADKHSRSIQMALKKIRASWVAGESLPGYGTWREWWLRQHPGKKPPRVCPGFPLGWSPENLRRKLDTSKFRRAVQTQGRAAAARFRPLVLTTRKGLYVGSHYMWDDVWHDHFVNSLAEKKAGRPLELFSHDYFSARKVRWGIRVRTENDDGSLNGLTARMMRMIVAATYYLDGYSERGTENVAEHGTAAFDEHMERVLYDASGGLITVNRSGMQGNAGHLGQYNGRRTGNPRFKASLESSNNVVHNLLSDLPGQTGPTRERRPEQLHGLLKYNDRLLAACQQLPLDMVEQLQWPLLEVNQFIPILGRVYQFLENDTEHELEGWAECGHFTQDIHLLGQWHTADELMHLEGPEREMALSLLQSGALQTKPRKLSRREVWDRGAGGLVRIHGGTVCDLLGEDFAQERKVRSHQFCFEDREVGPGEHRFEGIITDIEGRMHALTDGETYQVFINPFAPDQLFVRDGKGRFLGIAQRTEKVSRGDLPALERAMGHAKHIESEVLTPLRLRQAGEARRKIAMHRNNAAVLGAAAAQQEAQEAASTDALNEAMQARRNAFAHAATGTAADHHHAHANNNINDTTDDSESDW
jgi:hypothetical protein